MKNTNKKILYYCETYAFGGIEKVVDTMYNYFSKDYKCTILCGENLTNKKINSLLKRKLNHYLRTHLCFKKFDDYLKNNKYDIIHINIYNGIGLKYAYIARKYTPNVIVHAHSSNFTKDILHIKKYVNKRFIKKYSNDYSYISVSNGASQFCYNKDSLIVNNPIEYDMYKYNNKYRDDLRKKYGINNDSLVIGNIGRFSKEKNHKFLINLFNEYQKKNNNSYLVLIGEGHLKKIIISYSKKLKVNNVIFIDYQKDIYKYYNMFDIFMLPSLFEGLPLTIIESQINGLYTIMSKSITNDAIISKNVVKLDLEIDKWLEYIYKVDRNNKVSDRLNTYKVLSKIKPLYYTCNDKVSVIVPMYNSSKTIKRCIDSILNQAYSNIELIIVDDYSNDNSVDICNSYSDKRIITLVNDRNYGPGPSRNKGIEKSTGKYISFIDSDDYIDSDYINEMISVINRYDADIVCSSFKTNSNSIKLYNSIDALSNMISLPSNIKTLPGNKLFKKDSINDIRFINKKNGEDSLFNAEVIMNSKSIIYYDKCMYHYTYNENSLTNSKYNKNFYDRRITSNIIYEKYKHTKLSNDLYSYYIFNSIGVLNKMILSKHKNNDFVKELTSEIKNYKKRIKSSHYSIIKKNQVYLLSFNYYLYKYIYLIISLFNRKK